MMNARQFYDWQTSGGADDVLRLVDCLVRENGQHRHRDAAAAGVAEVALEFDERLACGEWIAWRWQCICILGKS